MNRLNCLLLMAMIFVVAAASAARGGYYIDDLRARLDYTDQDLADAEYELANAIADRDAQAGARDQAMRNLDAANAARADALASLEGFSATARGLSDSLTELSLRMEDLQKQVASAEEKFDASVKAADELRQSAVGQFEAGAPHRDVIASIEKAEARLDRLFDILDSTEVIGDWFVALPQLPAEPIVQRALTDHDSAVDRLQALRQDFENRMERDPKIAAADAQAKANADVLNPLAEELRQLETQRAEMTRRLDESNTALSDQQASLDGVQRDIERWQQTASASEAALASAEQRVLAASSNAAHARQARDLAYANWRDASRSVVIVPGYSQPYYYNYGYYYYDRYRYPYRHGYRGHGDRDDDRDRGWRDDDRRDDDRRDADRRDADQNDGSRIIRPRDESFRDGGDAPRRKDDDRPRRAEQRRPDASNSAPSGAGRPPMADDERGRTEQRAESARNQRFREGTNRQREEQQRAERRRAQDADQREQAERQQRAERQRQEQQQARERDERAQRDHQQGNTHRAESRREEPRRNESRPREDRGKRYERD